MLPSDHTRSPFAAIRLQAGVTDVADFADMKEIDVKKMSGLTFGQVNLRTYIMNRKATGTFTYVVSAQEGHV